jgi:xanthine dehydrogenase large subunit
MIWDRLVISSDYFERRRHINDFNRENEFVKRGLALTPVKFGISFTTSFLNQAGALVLIYKDGSVLVNHGGTEMGQGLHTKIWQIAASEFGLPYDKIKVNATNTSKVPNTSPTAASSGTDLNGMAVKNAIDILKSRLEPCAKNMVSELFGSEPESLAYQDGYIADTANPDHKISFEKLVQQAHLDQISLSTTGYYRTPDIFFDREKGKGTPFYYFSYGMAVSEVEVDVLTGKTRLLRSDILHDVGDSINEGIDLGQVTGGFIQGLGWCTTEVVRWDKEGRLLNHSPDTYKIPGIGDMPEVFNVELLQDAPNPAVIKKSKAVGEPPFMLAFSVWLAIKDAISAVENHEAEPYFELPASNEVILLSIAKLRMKAEKI